MSIEHIHDLVEEAREEYQEKKHKQLTIWKNESHADFVKRKNKHKGRVEKLDDLIDHLRKKAKVLEVKKEKRKEARKDAKNPYDKGSEKIVTFDGKQTTSQAAYWMYESRKHGWGGSLVSGFRTPEYSTSLCIAMCGAPSCPGRCAGAASNHAKTSYPGPAIDVSDYTNFERIQFEIGSPFRNDLPIDPVHFSLSGH